MKTALSIAGSDCSGGAGIQADLKAMTLCGVYAMSAITALTAQNTLGVTGILDVPPEFLAQQLDAVFQDIPPQAVKIGMISSPALVEVIVDRLTHYHAQNIVVDPVMVATSGAALSKDSAIGVMKEKLFPLATVITPNIPEAQQLLGRSITTPREMEQAAQALGEAYGCGVLCKGGHSVEDANDLLYAKGTLTWFHGQRIDNPNTHGTGCTLSSAMAAYLALGYPLEEAIRRAKAYLSGALADMLDLGHGSGPLNHAYALKKQDLF